MTLSKYTKEGLKDWMTANDNGLVELLIENGHSTKSSLKIQANLHQKSNMIPQRNWKKILSALYGSIKIPVNLIQSWWMKLLEVSSILYFRENILSELNIISTATKNKNQSTESHEIGKLLYDKYAIIWARL